MHAGDRLRMPVNASPHEPSKKSPSEGAAEFPFRSHFNPRALPAGWAHSLRPRCLDEAIMSFVHAMR